MDERLAQREWLAGDYGYADIAFFMAQLFAARMAAPMVLDALVAYLERSGLDVPEFARRAA